MVVIAMLGYISFLGKRDDQLLNQYDACQQFTHHPDCPDSWKTKPAFSHR